MKSFFKITLTAVAAVLLSFQATAQVKIGSNPTTANAAANLEVEATDATKFYIQKADGKVGIGTTAPGIFSLDVVGTTDGNVAARIWNKSTAANASSTLTFGNDASQYGAYIFKTGSGYIGTLGANTFVVGNGGGATAFVQNGAEKMRIDLNGNAHGGTGNTVSATGVHSFIWGNGNIVTGDNSATFGLTNTNNSKNSLVFGNGNSLAAGTGQTNRGTLLGGGGNVVSGDSYNSFFNGSQNTISGACFESIITGYLTTVSNSQKVVVSGQGHNVSDATGSAVFGNFSTVSAPSALVAGAGNTVGAGANYGIALGESNTVGASHLNSMAIGKSATTTAAGQFATRFAGGYRFETNSGGTTGATMAAGSGSWTSISDRRAKDNIKDINYGLATVMQLRPTMYNYKGQKNTSLGFIAQEVKEIIPEVVEKTDMGPNHDYIGIKYTEMIPVITKAVQELKKENDDLKQEVAQLKAQMAGIASLAEQVKELQALVSNNKAVNATEATVKTGKK